MTQEWINQFNNKCAEFLGYVNTTPTDKDFNIYQNDKGMIIGNKIYTMLETMSMKFHSDWNWIMVVVEKINSLRGEDNPDGVNAKVFYFQHIMFHEIIGKRETLLNKIDQFIDWYNEQKK